MISEDTIAAISTAPGEGGIGIVRISGDEALNILDRIFTSRRQKDTMSIGSYTLRYGHVADLDGKVIDEVLVSYMKSPNTYTREDVVEINCHGGVIPVKRILEAVLKAGARLAEPGEFTKRAFLNGRIDLSQAEAVIDMIRSKTDKSMDAALKQLEGKLSLKLQHIRGELIDIMSHIEASIDFPEDDIEDVLYLDLERDCGSIIGELDEIIQGADAGKILREGLNTVIVGKPNVGKSSLLNALLEENRAIVTDVPGTTRDIIEEYLNIGGIPINIIDTAGIRETSDEVERIGVEKTREYFDRADLVIFILDSGGQLSREDENIFSLIGEKKTIILINKVDLPQRLDRSRVEELGRGSVIIDVSVREGMGIDRLKEEIQNLVYSGEASFSSEILVTNVRHKDLLVRASECLKYCFSRYLSNLNTFESLLIIPASAISST
jgi:tRNA modification GTPase